MLAYRAMRAFFKVVLGVFFRQIHVVGLESVPAEGEGPVIFAGNHPNSLIDPMVIVTNCERIVHFAAKDVLFESPLRPFLAALGAVPVARRKDHPDGPLDNESAFAALNQVLIDGRAMGIFPEGISHNQSQLAKLKTGAARIALGLAVDRPDVDLVIVPTGLTFVHPRRFRSRSLVQFGVPIRPSEEELALWATDPRAAARALTDRIDEGMRALTVNAPDWETLTVLDAVRRLYQPPKISFRERVELARRFSLVYPQVKDQPAVAALYGDVEDYLAELSGLGLQDRDLRRPLSIGWVLRRGFYNLLLALVWLPLALPGLLIHAPLGLLVSWMGLRMSPRKDVIGTSKLVGGLAAVAMLYLSLPFLAWWFGDLSAAIGLAVGLPFSGYAAIRVMERGVSLRRVLGSGLRSFTLRRRIEALRERRAALEARVVAMVSELIPEDMVPLFPREPGVDGSQEG